MGEVFLVHIKAGKEEYIYVATNWKSDPNYFGSSKALERFCSRNNITPDKAVLFRSKKTFANHYVEKCIVNKQLISANNDSIFNKKEAGGNFREKLEKEKIEIPQFKEYLLNNLFDSKVIAENYVSLVQILAAIECYRFVNIFSVDGSLASHPYDFSSLSCSDLIEYAENLTSDIYIAIKKDSLEVLVSKSYGILAEKCNIHKETLYSICNARGNGKINSPKNQEYFLKKIKLCQLTNYWLLIEMYQFLKKEQYFFKASLSFYNGLVVDSGQIQEVSKSTFTNVKKRYVRKEKIKFQGLDEDLVCVEAGGELSVYLSMNKAHLLRIEQNSILEERCKEKMTLLVNDILKESNFKFFVASPANDNEAYLLSMKKLVLNQKTNTSYIVWKREVRGVQKILTKYVFYESGLREIVTNKNREVSQFQNYYLTDLISGTSEFITSPSQLYDKRIGFGPSRLEKVKEGLVVQSGRFLLSIQRLGNPQEEAYKYYFFPFNVVFEKGHISEEFEKEELVKQVSLLSGTAMETIEKRFYSKEKLERQVWHFNGIFVVYQKGPFTRKEAQEIIKDHFNSKQQRGVVVVRKDENSWDVYAKPENVYLNEEFNISQDYLKHILSGKAFAAGSCFHFIPYYGENKAGIQEKIRLYNESYSKRPKYSQKLKIKVEAFDLRLTPSKFMKFNSVKECEGYFGVHRSKIKEGARMENRFKIIRKYKRK